MKVRILKLHSLNGYMVLGPEISAYIISYTPSFTPLSKMPHHTSSDSSRHSDPLYHCESHCFTCNAKWAWYLDSPIIRNFMSMAVASGKVTFSPIVPRVLIGKIVYAL